MLHKKFETNVINTFRKMGIDVEVANRFLCLNFFFLVNWSNSSRFNYTQDRVDWADVVVPTGGDGTFLLASSKIRDNTKPVIGFNSDPNRSEGHLCLPKKYSANIRSAIEKLQKVLYFNTGLFTRRDNRLLVGHYTASVMELKKLKI